MKQANLDLKSSSGQLQNSTTLKIQSSNSPIGHGHHDTYIHINITFSTLENRISKKKKKRQICPGLIAPFLAWD